MAAEAAADVTEEEALVAGVEAVRQGPVEPRQARPKAGAVASCAAALPAALTPASATPDFAAAAPAIVSRQRRTLCKKAWTRVT